MPRKSFSGKTMDLYSSTDPIDLKVRELLKEVQLDYSPTFTKLVDDTVWAIKEAIDKIPEDLQVSLFPHCCFQQNPDRQFVCL